MSSIILALIIGAAFGAVLDRVGATNPNWIGKMLALKHLHLMKTILLAIGTGAVLMFGGQMLGLVDVGHMSVKAAYVGVFIGGLLLGAGWAASGYCPGTGVCAAASGRKDALFFIAGGLLGAAAYMATYPAWKASGMLDDIAGGKVTLGTVPGSGFDGIWAMSGDILGIVLGLVFIAIAFALPERLSGEGRLSDVPAE
ncbi:YeeE/YedE family protein [Lutimaribacter sp. EGI FJ00015]|uniref:YeeE/YedE family protein n=1 Tax=Lutimaribacter degradans TaxID=2945989 RepID=A0ACC5ZS22_9RHOB|nr:YeeE/YedE thiosulfate transporter family protein [Lutimaribacter sp. EGI FJ00013]MCM2560968.1 YeeE/YedE family protein [Lutimaribacter sp. EGI FJ00013]MCO0612086.1 YeeE/YedE family protein [Lutimaribacter sp. EGI FJ00015]MCO0634794.1 YeeE/YedE family protein [Lutimaribacter sp. EGI FJ00014]